MPDSEKIKIEIFSWLSQFGWPNIVNPEMFVINNIDQLFHHLMMRGLVTHDMYDQFVIMATDEWQKTSWGI